MSRFVIIASTRTGSNMLVKALDQHSQLRCEGEALKRQHNQPGFDYPNWMQQYFGDQDGVGYKLIYDHYDNLVKHGHRVLAVMDALNLKVILLRRRSLLKQYISFIAALSTGQWGEKVYSRRRDWILSPPKDRNTLQSKMAQWNRIETHILESLARTSLMVHEVWYEDLVEAWHETTHAVQQFLRVEIEDLPVTTIKQFAFEYHTVVENYRAMEQWMINNGYGNRI